MQMKAMIFGFGVMTGAALLMAVKPVRKALGDLIQDADQEIHAAKKTLISKGKQLKAEMSCDDDLTDEVNELSESLLDDLEALEAKGISTSSKKAFEKMKAHVMSLQNLTR